MVESLLRYIADGAGDFDDLARRLFVRQWERNVPYRRLCDQRGASPDTVKTWQDIPAVPAAAYKRLTLSCVPESECAVVFHSSGTTSANTSRNFLDGDGVALYIAALTIGYRRALPPLPILALMPSPAAAPHSSLSFMLDTLGARFVWPVDPAPLRALTEPTVVFGTAFAWVHLLDALDAPLLLPDGRYVIETGGFKGRSREIPRAELYDLFREKLGVPDAHCVSEYGMSELASQFYGFGVDGLKVAPPWLKVRALDPETGRDVPDGEPGLLAFYDLANWNSCIAIQTEDMGRILPGGLELLGRAPGAILRGCSLVAE